ncbi:MAG: hypothetical protein V3T22_11650, partial [Planctomycetota bacterium]
PMLPVASEKLPGGGSEFRYQGTALPAGTHRVLVSLDDLDQLADTVTLEAGVATSRTIDLGQTSSGTRVAGEIRSQTGTYRGPTTLAAVDATGRMLQRQEAQWVKRDGDWVAPFAMDNMPAEGSELIILSVASHRRWSLLPVQIVPAMSDLILVCEDAVPVDNLMIRLVDAAAGKPLNGGWGAIELEGCERSETSIRGQGTSFFSEVAFDALTGWYAACEGFVPRWGDASAFVPEQDMLVAEVALEPGWGARIRTLAASTFFHPSRWPGSWYGSTGRPRGSPTRMAS